MGHVKTAVSIEERLFRKAERIRKKLTISRSQFVSIALRNEIRKLENKTLVEKINRAMEKIYPDQDDEEFRKRMQDYYWSKISDEWK